LRRPWPRLRAPAGLLALAVLVVGACGDAGLVHSTPRPSSAARAAAPGVTGPLMGWNSWNAIRLGVDEAYMKAEARALVASGMGKAGYDYVVLDGGWRAPTRDARGEMQANPAKFPDGLRGLASYVHGLGLKFGVHQPMGMRDCSNVGPGTQTAPGGELQDAETFASWGVDFIKYDLCGYSYPPGTTPGAPDFAGLAVLQGATVLGRYPAASSQTRVEGGAVLTPCAACERGQAVTGIGLEGGSVRFEGVDAPADGDYTLEVSYVNVEHSSAELTTALRRRRMALLSVDGGAPQTTWYPIPLGPDGGPTGWGTVGTLSVPARLHAGHNTVTLSDPGSFEDVIRAAYERMAVALKHVRRPVVLSISDHGEARPWLWAPRLGSMWRTTNDLGDFWIDPGPPGDRGPGLTSIVAAVDEQVGLAEYAGHGGWNDPDMLQVGNGGTTPTEDEAQFSLWSVLAAPLFAGNDLTTMSPTVRQILLNREVIAVDQDPLGVEGRRIYHDGVGQVWLKPLADGSAAVVLLNTGQDSRWMATSARELGLRQAPVYAARDLWAHATTRSAGWFSALVPGHGVAMLRVRPQALKGTAP
jgi:alpha-galactosidase